MKLSKALNQKNKLVTELNSLYNKLNKYNSTIEGASKPYNAKDILVKIDAIRAGIVVLKTAVHRASDPVRDKIFLLSELKSHVKKINSLPTQDGVVREHSYRGNGEAVTFKAEITEVDQEKLVKELEAQIEQLQEELDAFNHQTEVTI